MRPLSRLLCHALLGAVLSACGGGGSSGGDPLPPGPGLRDATPYSTAPEASLSEAGEAAAVTTHSITVAGTPVNYTATAGHLTALAPGSTTAEATMFYVAYTVPSKAGPNRPIVYWYNGGPGSATVWLHLGSFAPRRIVTQAPSTTVPQPFQLVDNAESLIDVADLVFVDAVGTGYSEAIAPFTNQTFWGVDADAAVMRDFIARYAAVNGRQDSPTYLFGESYGTTRSAVLAHLMVAAGMRLDGVVLQSSILDYNTNCDMFRPAVHCEGFLPSYGMVGAWFGKTQPVPTDADAYAQQLRDFATSPYGPAVQSWIESRQPPGSTLLNQLVALTGAPRDAWAGNLDLDPGSFRVRLLPGQLLGRYDARIAAANGSPLTVGGDPSSTVITAPFTAAARSLFVNELQYTASATYTLLSGAINSWNFSHDGQQGLPDTIPDLAAAMAARPTLRTLSLSGYHDLATPFWQTERDLARLGTQPRLAQRVYPGGHMTYLDDASRVRIRADVGAFVTGSPLPSAVEEVATGPHDARIAATGAVTADGTVGASATAPLAEPLDRTLLPQGGDPYLPPDRRAKGPQTASPSGAALQALVARKIAGDQR